MQRAEQPMTDFGNVIAAFSEEHVERLTGLTQHRLRYWDRTNFFKPSLADDNRRAALSRVYSFKDVASLRVLSILLNQHSVSLQHLRQVSEKLKHLNEDRWIKTTLYVLNRRVIFTDPESAKPVEVVSGQWMLGIPLVEVLTQVRDAVAKLRERPFYNRGKIERNRLVAHNTPVLAGTRIPVRAIKNFAKAGYTTEQIIAEYPDLTPEDVQAALSYTEKSAAA